MKKIFINAPDEQNELKFGFHGYTMQKNNFIEAEINLFQELDYNFMEILNFTSLN